MNMMMNRLGFGLMMRLCVMACCVMLTVSAIANPKDIQTAAALANGDIQSVVAQFDAKMKQALSEAQLKALIDRETAKLGDFENVGTMRTEQLGGGYTRSKAECNFTNGDCTFVIVRNGNGEIAGLFYEAAWQSAAYVDTTKFKEVQTVVVSGDRKLGATLSLPMGDGPFPAVVLVHGSGPHGRDVAIGNTKVFADLAMGLASQGIAVLRYDKRTFVYKEKSFDDATSFTADDVVTDDAVAALKLLQDYKSIDQNKIGLVGHSLGGYMGPRIVAKAEGDGMKIGYWVSLAGSTLPMEDSVVRQLERMYEKQKNPMLKMQVDMAKQARKQIRNENLSADDTVMFLGQAYPGEYWLDLKGYDPVKQAGELGKPMLVVQGKLDQQVYYEEDFMNWDRGLRGKDGVEIVVFDDLGHVFIKDGQHVDERVIGAISDWIGGLE